MGIFYKISIASFIILVNLVNPITLITPITCFALAASETYEVKMDLLLNGKHISSPRVIIKEGETATIVQKTKTVSNFIEVVAFKKEAPISEEIIMKFTVGEISPTGARTIVSQPQIVAKENEPAQITVNAKEEGSEKLSLSIVTKKKNL